MRTCEGAATIPKKVKRQNLGTLKYSDNSAVRQFTFAKKLSGTRLASWTHQPGTKLVPKRTKYLGDQWNMNVVSLYAATGFMIRAFHTVGKQWLGSTPLRPTPTRLLSPRTPVHEDGGRGRNAPFSS